MEKRGTIDLPLHEGRTPRWLFKRMVKLSKAISEVIIDDFNQKEFLNRITNPYWFQAFACIIGFDWHSSGTTTTTCGALKMALDPEEHGIGILGGKGRASRKTPEEIMRLENIFSIKPGKIDDLVYTSKISAKIDNSCIQDDFQLYHHTFFLTENGEWGIVQQGMRDKDGYARRYHWLSEILEDFMNEPHRGVCCDHRYSKVLNMINEKSKDSREISVDLVNDNPSHLRRYFDKKAQTTLIDFKEDHYTLPRHHPVLDMDISERGWDILKKAYELQPRNYKELISVNGMGPKKIRALALVSDLIYGSEVSWKDPVKYSFAHGGKDGTPYPVDKDVYDSTIQSLERIIEKTEINEKEKKQAFKRLEFFINK